MKQKPFSELVNFIANECAIHNVKLDLRATRYVMPDPGIRCTGYFYDQPNGLYDATLTCATEGRMYKYTLAHEYCHMTQWLDKIPTWKKAGASNYAISEWLRGVDYRKIKSHIINARNLELDNEKRTLRLIKKYDCGIKPEDYVKNANAYVLFYNWLLETRRWSKPGKNPSLNKRILKLMSPKFNMNYTKLDDHIRQAFIEEGI